MLLNNESLEETIQDQQIEYEDRIAELEGELAAMCDDDDVSLRQKHQAALDTIVKLKKDISLAGGNGSNEEGQDDANVKRLEEENMELQQVIDHLSAENEAAKEIKYIVLELKSKNAEISEMLRSSQEQNNAAADIIESLKADNDQLRAAQDNPTSPTETHEHDNELAEKSAKIAEMEAELEHYKSMVSEMTRDRNVFNQHLSELMDASGIEESGTVSEALDLSAAPDEPEVQAGALVVHESSSNINPQYQLNTAEAHPQYNADEMETVDLWNSQLKDMDVGVNQQMVVAAPREPIESNSYASPDAPETSSYAPPPAPLDHPVDQVEEQINNLTIENGLLAQRLGNAVADKECKSAF